MTEQEIARLAEDVKESAKRSGLLIAVYFSRKSQKCHRRPLSALGPDETRNLVGAYNQDVSNEFIEADVKAFLTERAESRAAA